MVRHSNNRRHNAHGGQGGGVSFKAYAKDVDVRFHLEDTYGFEETHNAPLKFTLVAAMSWAVPMLGPDGHPGAKRYKIENTWTRRIQDFAAYIDCTASPTGAPGYRVWGAECTLLR